MRDKTHSFWTTCNFELFDVGWILSSVNTLYSTVQTYSIYGPNGMSINLLNCHFTPICVKCVIAQICNMKILLLRHTLQNLNEHRRIKQTWL